MSTYWGYVCRSHDPELISEHWFNHGDFLLFEAFHSVRAGAWPVDEWGDPAPLDEGEYATTAPIWWLLSHPRCDVALHNEYGVTKPIGEAS